MTDLAMTTPFTAALEGRDEDEQFLLSSIFLSMEKPSKEILSGPAASALIKGWITTGLTPESYAPALMKLIGLTALDPDLQPSGLPSVLQKIGLTVDQAQQLSREILDFLQPILVEQAADEATESLEPLPPLTTKIPPKPEGSTSSNVPARNIINLRKEQ